MTIPWSLQYAWAFYAAAFVLWLIAGAGLYVALFRDRSRGRRRCPKCWYDMAGVPGLKCPECGREARKERRLHTTRRRWRLATLFALIAALGLASFRASDALRHGPWAAVPVPILKLGLMYWADEAKVEYESRRGAFTPLHWVQMFNQPPPPGMIVPGEWANLLTAWHAARVLDDPTSTDHEQAIDALSGVGAHARLAIPQLRDVPWENQRSAVRLLGYLNTLQLPAALDALHHIALHGTTSSGREAAATEFIARTKGTVPPRSILTALLELACHDNREVALSAARTVVSLGKSYSLAEIIEVLNCAARHDPSFARSSAMSWDQTTATAILDSDRTHLHELAVQRLAQVAGESPEFRDRMLSIVSGSRDGHLRPLCVGLLGEVRANDPRITPALVRAGLHDPVHSVRAVAIRAAESRRDADNELVATLIEALKDPSPHVVLAAANSLARLGPRAAAAHDALRAAADHPDASARDAIADAIEKTKPSTAP